MTSMDPTRDLDLVVFDCDGVLVDSGRLTVEVEARMLTEMGWPITLGLAGLRPLFEGRIYSGSEVARGKRWPDLFVYAARSMGAEPRRCAVIEDSINGARAANAAGMSCYGFAGGLTRRADLEATGATVFDTMAELRLLLVDTGCAGGVHEAETQL